MAAAGWQGNLFGPPRPLCSVCGVRGARPHHAVGFWSTCARCARHAGPPSSRLRRSHPRLLPPCPICHGPRSSSAPALSGTCSPTCAYARNRARMASHRATVLAALGNRCACPGIACFHPDPCPISQLELLEVDHTRNDGARVRRSIRSSRARSFGQNSWHRYARALQLPDHGMQLLCANCHRWVTVQRRIESKKSSHSV